MSYNICLLPVSGGKFRVCVVSPDNGKLVLQGEPLANEQDGIGVMAELRYGKHQVVDNLKKGHKFTRNSGPKKAKKAARKK